MAGKQKDSCAIWEMRNYKCISMRIILLVIFLSLFYRGYGQTTYSDSVVYWGTHPLTWADFKGPPSKDTAEGDVAETSSGPAYSLTRKGDSLYYEVGCIMYKYSSWTLTHLKYDLIHEQGHFNISEIIARKIMMYFCKLPNTPGRTWNRIVHDADSIKHFGLEHLQNLYDNGTNYGSDTLKQKEWNIKIARMLNSLKQYSKQEGVVYYKLAEKKRR